jgi:hypothetical protein
MATRMQQRRGTASQWVSSNAGAGPILNAGEIGWESDTNKFKIGDGVNNWASLDYFADSNSTVNPAFGTSIVFEGATADSFETTLAVTDPTADRTITFPDSTGTVALTSDITVTASSTTTLTNKTLTSPVVSGLTLSDSSIVIEGSTANEFETTITVTDPTADRTITFPDATGTVVLADGSGNVTVSGDLTVSGTTTTINSTTINATTGIVFEGATANAHETTLTVTDPTADRTVTFQDATGTVVLRDSTDTLTNKSISLESNTITSTLAQLNTAVSDADLASLAGSETLTNKTLSSAVATTALTLNATAELRLADTDSTHYVGFKSPGTVTTNKVWVLPAADGTANQILTTDGSGNLSFATASAGVDEAIIIMGAY